MPTRNINLTEKLDRFVAAKIETGHFETVSEVVRAALRTMKREDKEHKAKITALGATRKAHYLLLKSRQRRSYFPDIAPENAARPVLLIYP